MWPFKKRVLEIVLKTEDEEAKVKREDEEAKVKREAERKRALEEALKKLAAVERAFPLGTVIEYLGVRMTVIGHYDDYAMTLWRIPGVKVQWMDSIQCPHEMFIPDCRLNPSFCKLL